MDYKELFKEKKVYYVAPLTGTEDDPSTKKDESVGETVAYVIADSAAAAINKVKIVDKSLVEGTFTVVRMTDIKDFFESITDKVQTKEIEVNGKKLQVEVKDGDPEYKHKYEAVEVFHATYGDGATILFPVKTADDVVAHLVGDPIEVGPYATKAYLINHLDEDAATPKADEKPGDSEPSNEEQPEP
jgi:hypothetical protein